MILTFLSVEKENQPYIYISPEDRQGNNQLQPQPAMQTQEDQDLSDLVDDLNSSRTCVITVANNGSPRDLYDPIVFIKDGHNTEPTDTTICSRSETVLVFEKRACLLGGTSGVVSYAYDIAGKVQKRFAAFWEVLQIRPNKFGICWMTVDLNGVDNDAQSKRLKQTCMEKTYKDFLRNSQLPENQLQITKTSERSFPKLTGDTGNLEETLKIYSTADNASVEATMEETAHAVLKIKFCDTT